jgi:hypothetical protein
MIFRKRVLFRVEETLPDPEEQKWTFRRRILLIALLVAIGILGVPVYEDRAPHLRTLKEARTLAGTILETRLYSMQHRVAVSLHLDSTDRRSWTRVFHSGAECTDIDTIPKQKFILQHSVWRIQPIAESSEATKEVHSLCFHPWKGLLIDGIAVENARVAVQGYPEEDIETQRTDRVAQLLLEQNGAAVTILRN